MSKRPDATRSRPARSSVERAFVALLRAAERARSCAEMIVEREDITTQQYNVLRILRGAEPDGLPTLTIADRMIERAPGITGLIDRLEAKGLVARERRTEDRRRVYCRITRDGLELLERLDAPVEAADRAVFYDLSTKELRRLTGLLERVGTTEAAARSGAD